MTITAGRSFPQVLKQIRLNVSHFTKSSKNIALQFQENITQIENVNHSNKLAICRWDVTGFTTGT